MSIKFNLTTLLGLLAALGASGTGCLTTGCAPQTTELERVWTQLNQEVIAPAVQKALAETSTRTATFQGSAQAIAPGYEIIVDGFFGTGVHAATTVRLTGVAGNLAGHVQTDAGQAGVIPVPVAPAKLEPVAKPGG